MSLSILRSPENLQMQHYSQHTTKILSSVNIILRSELKLILATFMVWVRDSNPISEKLQADGPSLIGIGLSKSTMGRVGKHMDSILFIYSDKSKANFTLTISETPMLWM